MYPANDEAYERYCDEHERHDDDDNEPEYEGPQWH